MRFHRLVAASVAAFVSVVALPPALARADSTRDLQWHLGFLNVPAAHKLSQGEGVTVAVVDTGVDSSHPDLTDAVSPGTDVLEQGGDGRKDLNGHGTAMAGLIAARGHGNGAGVLGIAPKATILPVRTDHDADLGIPRDQAAGIEWAASHGAKVICFAAGATVDPGVYRSAVDAAAKADVVLVAGVGNRPQATNVAFPAAIPGVLAVAGVDRSGNHADVSVAGPEVVLSAPAVDIVSTGLHGTYRQGTGTSDATAIIAGAAALVRAKYPKLSAPEVIHRLTATATDKGVPGRDVQYGYGVLNLVAALTADVPPAPPTGGGTGSPPAQPSAGRHLPVAPVVIVIGLLLAAVAVGWVALRRRGAGR